MDISGSELMRMETNKHVVESKEQECPETPQLIRFIAANEVHGFDNVENTNPSSVEDHRVVNVHPLNQLHEVSSHTNLIILAMNFEILTLRKKFITIVVRILNLWPRFV